MMEPRFQFFFEDRAHCSNQLLEDLFFRRRVGKPITPLDCYYFAFYFTKYQPKKSIKLGCLIEGVGMKCPRCARYLAYYLSKKNKSIDCLFFAEISYEQGDVNILVLLVKHNYILRRWTSMKRWGRLCFSLPAVHAVHQEACHIQLGLYYLSVRQKLESASRHFLLALATGHYRKEALKHLDWIYLRRPNREAISYALTYRDQDFLLQVLNQYNRPNWLEYFRGQKPDQFCWALLQVPNDKLNAKYLQFKREAVAQWLIQLSHLQTYFARWLVKDVLQLIEGYLLQ